MNIKKTTAHDDSDQDDIKTCLKFSSYNVIVFLDETHAIQ